MEVERGTPQGQQGCQGRRERCAREAREGAGRGCSEGLHLAPGQEEEAAPRVKDEVFEAGSQRRRDVYVMQESISAGDSGGAERECLRLSELLRLCRADGEGTRRSCAGNTGAPRHIGKITSTIVADVSHKQYL